MARCVAEQPFDPLQKIIDVERLGQIVVGAAAHQPDRLLDVTVGGDEQHRRRSELGERLAEDVLPGHVREPDVADQKVRALPLQSRQGIAAGLPPDRRIALELEPLDERCRP